MSESDRNRLNKAEEGYNKTFGSRFKTNPQDHNSLDSSRSAIENGEKNAGKDGKKAIADTAAGKAALATAGTAGGPVGKIATTLLGKIRTKQGGAGVAVAAVLLLIGSVGFFSTFLAPIAFVENVIDDLNDQLASLDARSSRMMRAKVSYDEKNKAFKGCTKLSIRCKAKSLSARQVRNFEEKGITVKGKTLSFAGVERTFPDSYDYDGKNYKPAEFVNSMKTNTALRLAFKRAVNMRFMGFSDNRYLNWTQKKLGISKRKPTLTGNEAERIKKLATLQDNRVTADTKFVQVLDNDGKPVEGPDGKPVYMIENGNPNVTFSQTDVDKITSQFGKLSAMMDSFGKVGTQALKVLSVVGYLDMACSVKNMIGMAATTTKVFNQYSTAQYAAPIMSLAYAQKASDISAEDSNALNSYFLNTDPRQEIPDVEKSYIQSVADGNGTVIMKENDYYGKNVMDSPLYEMSTYGGVAEPNTTSIRYSLGLGRTTLLGAVGATATIMNEILNIGTDNAGCDIVQNWAVRGLSFIVGIVALIASGGTYTAGQAGVMVALAVAFMAANAALMAALTNDIVPEGIEDLPEDKAALTWAGAAVITSTSAQSRGMMPASANEIVEYQNLQQASLRDYTAIAREDSSFFDVKNPHSPAGRTILALDEFTPSSYTVPSVLASLTSLQSTTVSRVLSGNAYAADDKVERFKHCDDSAYEAIGVDADVQCNVRFVMSDQDLNRDPEAVMDYMESNGYVELDDEVGESITGLPEGYTPPDPEKASSFIKDMAAGVVNQFWNTRTFGATDAAKEYGKFLDYCVYRAMPYGTSYEENTAWGSAEDHWITGEKCRSQEEMISIFRTYTMDVTLDDTIQETAAAPEVVAPSDGSGFVTGSNQDLAKQILSSGKVTGDSRYMGQIQAYARGDYSCNIDTIILRLLATISQKHTIYISSLNRFCTGVLPSTTSPHYINGGGHAVDINRVDGVGTTGATASELALINEYMPKMPPDSVLGQRQCRPPIVLPAGIRQIDDKCHHIHIAGPMP